MHNGNAKKAKQLGMSGGKATNILRKAIMFMLIQKLGLDICHRCGKKIETVNELSIEHMTNWLDSENPIEIFFDLNNITFSHFLCNISYKRHGGGKKSIYTKEERHQKKLESGRKRSKTNEYKSKNKLYMRTIYADPNFWERHLEDSRKSYWKKHNKTASREIIRIKLCCPNCGKFFDRAKSKTHLGSRKGNFTSCSRHCAGTLRRKLQLGEKIDFSKNVIEIYRILESTFPSVSSRPDKALKT